jgi:ATP/maltotriose-dependent transcriptional regulator MalT
MGSIESTRIVLAKAIELAERLDDTDAHWVTRGMHFYCGEFHKAQSAAEHFSRIARRSGDPAFVLIADRLIGETLHQQGKLRDAERCFARVVKLYIAPNGRRDNIMFRHYHRVRARAMLARVLWLRGFLDQAIDQARASLEEAQATQATEHKVSICSVLHYAVCPVTLATGDLSAVERAVAMLIDIAATPNVMLWKVMARCQQARLLIKRGEFAALFWSLRAALSLAHLKLKQGRADSARQTLEPMYARFTESFQTPDLRSARSMLETLGRA